MPYLPVRVSANRENPLVIIPVPRRPPYTFHTVSPFETLKTARSKTENAPFWKKGSEGNVADFQKHLQHLAVPLRAASPWNSARFYLFQDLVLIVILTVVIIIILERSTKYDEAKSAHLSFEELSTAWW